MDRVAGDGEERGFEHLSEGAEMSRGWQGNRGERGLLSVVGIFLQTHPPLPPPSPPPRPPQFSAFHLSFALHVTSFLLSHLPLFSSSTSSCHLLQDS